MQAGLGSGYSSAGRQFRIGPNGTPVNEKSPFGSQLNSNLNQSVGFGLSIPIFNGLASGISVTRAKIQFQNASIAEQSAKNNLNKVISQAVLDLRASQRRYYSAQTAFQSSKEAFRVIDQRYTVGLVNSLDYNQSQTNLNKAQFDLIQAKYDLIFRSKVIDFYLGNPLQF